MPGIADKHVVESRFIFFAALAFLLAVSLFLGCLFGPVDFSFSEVLHAFLARAGLGGGYSLSEFTETVVVDIRLSRVVLSALVGAALSISGVTFQGILRNPLADPFTIGVASGAAFGASLAIFSGLGNGNQWFEMGILPLAGMAGAGAALFAVIFLSRMTGRLRRDTLILAGIVVATFLSALISLLKSLDEESVSSIVFWVMGSFQGRGWGHVFFSLPYMAVGSLLIFLNSRELDILSLGETQAAQLGVDATRVRLRLLLGASLLAAASVSVSGIIGFVGLVFPHMVRMFLGAEHRGLLVGSALLGAVALMWSDIMARSILPAGQELPVGVITALFGGPFFFFILRRQQRRAI